MITDRTCTKCGQLKPDSEFYHYTKGREAGKALQPCKRCSYFITKEYRKKNWEAYSARARITKQVNKEKYSKVSNLWRKRNAEKCRTSVKLWQSKNRERIRIVKVTHNRLRRALAKGLISRPNLCEKCGKGGKIEAAHSDYSKPLEVKWLCMPCHRTWDSQKPKTPNATLELQKNTPPVL